jgi:uncharacterized protein YndB with AHSA1/START domain
VRIKALLRAAMVAFAALGLSAPAMAEVARSTDNSFVVRHEVVVEASPKDVWLALISPARWWRKDHTWSGDAANLTLTPQAGGCFCETIPAVDEPDRFTLQGSVEHMRVIQAYPEAALRMQGALGPLQSEPVTGILTIVITKVEQGTRILWEYNVGGPMRYEVPVISKAVDGVMGSQVAALGKLLGPVAVPVSGTPKTATEAPAAAATNDAVPAKAPVAPVIKPAPVLSPNSSAASAPAVAPVSKPSGAPTLAPTKPAAASPAAKPAQKPAATPTPKAPAQSATKPGSVDEAFSDIKDDPPRQ